MHSRKAQPTSQSADKPSSPAPEVAHRSSGLAPADVQAAEARALLGGREAAEDLKATAPADVQLHVQSPAELQASEMRSMVGASDIRAKAAEGVSGRAQQLPHGDQIQQAFGQHDVSDVKAHVGGDAAEAAGAMGAVAYASGDHVAFKGSPDLRTAAHEAAHVVQQRHGVQLKGGLGQAGDPYERQADAVAERVVQGRSAESLLSTPAAQSGATSAAEPTQRMIQFLGERLDAPLPEGSETPAHAGGRGATEQRRYSVEQYLGMWEEERGRKMTDAEKETLARGCIGITAVNLEAVNPPLDHAYATFDQAMAVVNEWNAFIEKHKGETLANGLKVGEYKAYMFAKLFWSNQRPYDHSLSPGENRRLSRIPDTKTYLPDPDTGKVDMSKYYYRGQPKALEDLSEEEIREGKTYYVNFDYGFWDEDSQCFWHANHSEPGMKVYQSTKDKFAAGYIDFDSIVYCAAIGKKFDHKTAAETHI